MGTFKARLCVRISGAFAGACIAGSAAAQTPLVHLPFDGSVQNIGSVGEAKLYLDEGLAAPTYVEGKLGRAMHFSEGGVVAIPFNFDHAEYPQATVTAWIKDESNEGSRRNILSTGSGAGINFFAMGSNRMNLRLGRKTRYHSEQYKDEEWVFVAGIVDTQSGSLKIWQNADLFEVDGIETTTLPPASYVAPGDDKSKKQPYIFVGKHSFSDRGATRFPLTIDDVRLYAEALTPSQIEEIRNSTALVVADAPTGGSSIGETEKNIETRPSGPPILHKPEGGPQIDKELPQAKQDVTTLPSVPTTGGRDISGVDRPGNGPIDIVEEAKKETAERERSCRERQGP